MATVHPVGTWNKYCFGLINHVNVMSSQYFVILLGLSLSKADSRKVVSLFQPSEQILSDCLYVHGSSMCYRFLLFCTKKLMGHIGYALYLRCFSNLFFSTDLTMIYLLNHGHADDHPCTCDTISFKTTLHNYQSLKLF